MLNLYECFYTFYTNRRRIFSLSFRKQPMKKKEAQFLGNQSARLRPRGYVLFITCTRVGYDVTTNYARSAELVKSDCFVKFIY